MHGAQACFYKRVHGFIFWGTLHVRVPDLHRWNVVQPYVSFYCVVLTCSMPYLISMSRKWYSRACGGRGRVDDCVCAADTPVEGGPTPPLPPDSWYASTLARLASTGSEAKARVSLHSSTGCSTCRIFGCRNLSSWRTLPRRTSVTVSFLFGLCSFSADLFSNRNTETSCNSTKVA